MWVLQLTRVASLLILRAFPRWTSRTRVRAPSGPAPVVDLLGGPGRFAFEVAGHEQVPLVVQLAPLGQGDLHLGPAVLEVEGDRDQSQCLLLGLAHELVDLAPV